MAPVLSLLAEHPSEIGLVAILILNVDMDSFMTISGLDLACASPYPGLEAS